MRIRALSSQSLSSDLSTESVITKYVDLLTVQVEITNVSSPVGSGKIQVSEDNSNWSDIDGSDFAISSNGVHNITIADYSHKYARVGFDISSGSFTTQVIFSGIERRS